MMKQLLFTISISVLLVGCASRATDYYSGMTLTSSPDSIEGHRQEVRVKQFRISASYRPQKTSAGEQCFDLKAFALLPWSQVESYNQDYLNFNSYDLILKSGGQIIEGARFSKVKAPAIIQHPSPEFIDSSGIASSIRPHLYKGNRTLILGLAEVCTKSALDFNQRVTLGLKHRGDNELKGFWLTWTQNPDLISFREKPPVRKQRR